MMKTVAAVNLTLTELIPLSRDGKPDSERVADLCDRQGLQSLTAVDVVTPIVALIKAKKSSDDVLQHIGKAVSDADSKSPSFINDLTTAIITGITSTVETDGTKSPDAKQTAAEKAAVEQYSPVLKKLCHLNSTLQLHVLCSIQTFAHKHSQPMGLVDRWFEYMYDEDVVEELAFDNYKKDSDVSKSSPYEGKNQALKLADAMYTRLAQPEEPDDEDKA